MQSAAARRKVPKRPRRGVRGGSIEGAHLTTEARHAYLVTACVSGEHLEVSAAKLGMSIPQARIIRATEDFKRDVRAAIAEANERFQKQLEAAREPAIRMHYDLLAGQIKGALAKDRLRAAESVLDRAGAPRQSAVTQSGTTAQIQVGAPAEFFGKSPQELLHFAQHGEWPPPTPETPADPA